eukprot:gnl/TRDRNA2_/TRDRNA2_64801_c0_seq1.p1 gnl/TRDRNA2_/TRDRNA2_64801_c0~~gnl/TRDRNA2_/TRDRNA2_64801_c0_seq1.p1  ORF type:complete len:119 (-),score=19.90 gnl/TRDRNA2_/TRDRNA2_64801_c0_seq1:404-760(-)
MMTSRIIVIVLLALVGHIHAKTRKSRTKRGQEKTAGAQQDAMEKLVDERAQNSAEMTDLFGHDSLVDSLVDSMRNRARKTSFLHSDLDDSTLWKPAHRAFLPRPDLLEIELMRARAVH